MFASFEITSTFGVAIVPFSPSVAKDAMLITVKSIVKIKFCVFMSVLI
ncbi:hypothetical protein C900_03463 [Fulvivirga imtechensis AK7]|uniref:Uncharacterized protein n=1 Tax=Fulvivirga imtechensis AK7 TaxID=1237149 RepID=L8JPC2_9BACT|nr:hypothetical protein C900_03463 [Fulvivirga imtechensis AK7]